MRESIQDLAARASDGGTEAQARRRLHLQPLFVPGQIWRARDGLDILGDRDLWTIVAISQHPLTPVIAQNSNGSTREFDLNGYFGGSEDGEEYPQDLVTLVREAGAMSETPRPWIVGDVDEAHGVPFIEIDADELPCKTICRVWPGLDQTGDFFELKQEDHANAALIVRAVNERDGLIVALSETLGLIRRAQERLCIYLHPDADGGGDDRQTLNELLEMFDGPAQRAIENPARAVLAKATQP